MADEVASEDRLLAESLEALKRSLWPVRFCAAFFFSVAILCAMLFIYQAMIYRPFLGELYIKQPGAWFHVLGHLVRGVVTALLAQRLLVVSTTTSELIRASSTIEQSDTATLRYFRVMRLWWATFAWCLAVLLVLAVTTVAVPLWMVMKQMQSPVYQSALDEAEPVRVSFHIAQDDPKDGYEIATLSGTEDVIYLDPKPFLTNSDIVSAQVMDSPEGHPSVGVKFADNSVEKVRQFTTVNMNKRLAIRIDDVVIMAPIIRYTVGESAMITGSFDREEAQRIAKGIVGARDR